MLGSVWMMLLNLPVSKLEYLQAITESCLCSLCFTEEVHHLLVWICLLDIPVVKVHNCISIWECLASYLIAEDDLFLVVAKHPLYLAIISDDFILHGDVWSVGVVVLVRVLKVILAPVNNGIIELFCSLTHFYILEMYIEIIILSCTNLCWKFKLILSYLRFSWTFFSGLFFNPFKGSCGSAFALQAAIWSTFCFIQCLGEIANALIDLVFYVFEFFVVVVGLLNWILLWWSVR